ncbi:MAG TPA: ArsA-related P-loop ATPase [Polyangia bacterium]|nr:ArsA-related P-loop ATPase [Polyangia bacterium]
MTPLITDLRFVVISGKGGVGRTTVAVTLARVAAGAGKRVLVAAAAATDRIGRMFGRDEPLGPTITALAPNIDGVNITPASSLHEYGLKVLRSELITRAVFDNRAVRGLLGAIPGLDAYALLGKAWWHTTEMQDGRSRYDLVIFDGPATGHVALMLRIPQAILNVMPKGPLAGDARAIKALLEDPTRAALVIVTLAEELPAREALELVAQARGPLAVPLGPLVVNALPTDALSAPALDSVMAAATTSPLAGTPGDAPLQATLRLAAGVRAHREAADRVLAGLKRDLGMPMITLPRIPTAEIGPAIIAELVPHLAEQIR